MTTVRTDEDCPALPLAAAGANQAARVMATTEQKTESKPAAPKPAVPKGPLLSQLFGMPEARAWGEALAADIAQYKKGALDWSHVDPGLVLYGPPGTGKTTLARAIAATCGLPLIATSYSEWSRGSTYGIEVMNAILATFELARKAAPCVVAIDEIDSLPSRASLPEEHHSTFSIVNTLLDQLDGLNKRPGIVVIGTCNNHDRLDPALIRPGRLGRSIEVPMPGLDALPHIIKFHLGADATTCGDLSSIAIMCVGMSGAAIEQLVRDARSIARRQNRRFGRPDLVGALQTRTELRDAATDWRISVHEAGHAVAACRLLHCPNISVSIVPSEGRAGTASYSMPNVPLTRANLVPRLAVMLAGRAAEEVFLGDVSAGAGGRADSDLGKATSLALDAVGSYGLSASGDLFWHRAAGEAVSRSPLVLQKEAADILTSCYREAKALVSWDWDFVNNVAMDLIRHRAIGHAQFRSCDRNPKPFKLACAP